jgi:hypothetical protein
MDSKILIVLLSILLLSSCSINNKLSLENETKSPPDPLMSSCMVYELYPKQHDWSNLLVKNIPECTTDSGVRDALVENFFTLGVVSFRYPTLTRIIGINEGTKLGINFSVSEREKAFHSESSFVTQIFDLRTSKIAQFVEEDPHICVSNSIKASIFASGYDCATKNVLELRDVFMEACVGTCENGMPNEKYRLECKPKCIEALEIRKGIRHPVIPLCSKSYKTKSQELKNGQKCSIDDNFRFCMSRSEHGIITFSSCSK